MGKSGLKKETPHLRWFMDEADLTLKFKVLDDEERGQGR